MKIIDIILLCISILILAIRIKQKGFSETFSLNKKNTILLIIILLLFFISIWIITIIP